MIQYFRGRTGVGVSRTLDNMYRDRKRVFVDMLKWKVPVVDGQFEIDQFDGQHAVYLISAGDDGEHLGSIRLLPTDRPYLLGSIFSHLCDAPPPSGADIWEITRGCLSPRLRAAERLRVRNRLTTAAVQFALLHSVRRFVCVADSGWLTQILALGWVCEPLGQPRLISGTVTGALQIHIGADTIDRLRAAGSYASVKLAMAGSEKPLAA